MILPGRQIWKKGDWNQLSVENEAGRTYNQTQYKVKGRDLWRVTRQSFFIKNG